MNAADILKYGHLTVLQTIDGFPASAWETPGACGVWSVKDIIAHLASYEHVLVDVLATFLDTGSSPTPYLSKFTLPGSQFNDTHAQVMSMVAQIPVETLRQAGTIPWYGVEYALDDLIVYLYYGHKREHSAQIAAFLDGYKGKM